MGVPMIQLTEIPFVGISNNRFYIVIETSCNGIINTIYKGLGSQVISYIIEVFKAGLDADDILTEY